MSFAARASIVCLLLIPAMMVIGVALDAHGIIQEPAYWVFYGFASAQVIDIIDFMFLKKTSRNP